ncbi:MAG: molecular chaperone HtpG, partial [Candidatus Coproplasma sp.]
EEKPEEVKTDGDKKEEKAKEPTTIYYVSDEKQQAQYVKMFKDAGLNAICCDTFIDPHFISFIEYKVPGEIKFMRIDADVAGALKGDEAAEDSALCEIFKNAINDEHITVKCQALKNTEIPAVINVDEYMRRYSEMGQFYGMTDDQMSLTLMINTANPVVASIKGLSDDKQKFVSKYIYSLALLSYKKLSPDELQSFVAYNMQLLDSYVK